jgi:hypothetical protein
MINKDGKRHTMKIEDQADVKELNKLLSLMKQKQEAKALSV